MTIKRVISKVGVGIYVLPICDVIEKSSKIRICNWVLNII